MRDGTYIFAYTDENMRGRGRERKSPPASARARVRGGERRGGRRDLR